ncbi:MAG: T9SS type A sorting domain-containing protein [Bacteroidota bacterium]
MRILILFLLVYSFLSLKAQSNLILNPSFEEYNHVPSAGLQSFRNNQVYYWTDPNRVSSDLYCPNSYRGFSTPPLYIPYGFQYPRTGKCFAGGVAFSNPSSFREYIQGTIRDSLKEYRHYAIKYYLSLEDESRCFTDFGFYFTDTQIVTTEAYNFRKPFLNPQYENSNSNWINTFDGWQEMKGIYTAHGREKFVTIGNFTLDSLVNSMLCKTITESPYDYAYYYIDDVAVYDTSIIDTIRLCLNDSVEINHQWYKPSPSIINESFDSGVVVRHYIESLPNSNSYTEFDVPYNTGDTIKVGYIWVCHSDSSIRPRFVCDSTDGISCFHFKYLWATPDTFVDAYFQNIYGCDSTVRYHVRTNVGIDDIDEFNIVELYPNPTNDYLHIDYNKNKAFYYRLFDISGKEIITKKILTPSIDISSLEKGMYILEIQDGKGNSMRKKVIKE